MSRTELRTEVEIQASPAQVYRVLTDFPRYPEWNPFLTAISGTPEVGAKLALELSLPEGNTYELSPTIERVVENEELRWRSHYLMSGLLASEHFFLLTAREPGSTRVVQGQNFSGLLLKLAGNALTLAARGAVYMNQALKKRAESLR